MPPRRQTLVVDHAGTVSRCSQRQSFFNHRAAAAAAYLPPLSATNEPGRVPVRASPGSSSRSGVKHADTLAFVMNPEFLCHAWTWIHRAGTKPSSGLIGIIMAIKMCKLPVNVYGFQYDGYFNHDLRPHYYDWERPKKGREHVHPFRQESDLFQRLMDARLLRLY